MLISNKDFALKIYKSLRDEKTMPLTVQELIDRAGLFYSISGFAKKFKTIFGMSPGFYIKHIRYMYIVSVIEKHPKKSGREIARMCRFATHSDLSRFLYVRNTSLTQIRGHSNGR